MVARRRGPTSVLGSGVPSVRAAKRGAAHARERSGRQGSSHPELVDFALPSHAALRCVLWETSEEQGHPRRAHPSCGGARSRLSLPAMKFGIAYANAGPFGFPEPLAHLARTAEEVGIESIWTVEHVVIPVGYQSKYPYDPSGKIPGPENVPIPDPILPLAFAAAVTKKLRLATGILILPQRHPIYVAKEVATLDVLSGGRAILGIGIGWLKEEFDALGIPFAERAGRTREAVRAIRSLWRRRRSRSRGSSSAGGRSSRTRSRCRSRACRSSSAATGSGRRAGRRATATASSRPSASPRSSARSSACCARSAAASAASRRRSSSARAGAVPTWTACAASRTWACRASRWGRPGSTTRPSRAACTTSPSA